jgi:copper transport protein
VIRRGLALLVGLAGVLLWLAAPASAHATLVTSNPADGARLKTAPATVTITFDESVGLGSLGYLHVTDQTGRRVDIGNAGHPNGDGTVISVGLRSGLGDGTYTESFRVISADSHPVAGVVRFVVGNGVLTAGPAGPSAVDRATGWAMDLARLISFAGFAALGGAWLLVVVWPSGRADRRARRIVWLGWGGLVVGTIGELLLQGPYAAGEGIGKVVNTSLVDGTLHTDYGQLHSLRLLLLGLVAIGLAWLGQRLESVSRSELALLLFAPALAWTFAMTGHPETTRPTWLSVSVDIAHLCAMAAWVGGLLLVGLALLPRNESAEDAVVLPRFSGVAFGAVCVIALSGSYAAYRGVGSLAALVQTSYGRLVLVKIVLFLGLITLGYISRQALRGAMPQRLRRSVLVEIVLAGLVLTATSVLVAQPRGPEALAVSYQRPVSRVADLGGGQSVEVTADPGKHGNVTVTVQVLGGAAPQSVSATATQTARQIGPLPIPLSRQAPKLLAASGVNLPVAGTWTFDLVVTQSEFAATTVSVNLRLH